MQLDVLDDESVAAAGTVKALDVLINNAGVLEPNGFGQPPAVAAATIPR